MHQSLLSVAMGSTLLVLAAQDVDAGLLYVTNRGSGDLAILDEASLTVRKVIPVGERAWGVAVAPDGKTACVSYGAGLAVVNLEAGIVTQRVALGGQGMGVAMSRDGALCYVAINRSGGDRLMAVELRGGQLRGQVPIGERAFGGEGSLSEIDTRTFQELRRIPLGKHHEQLTLDPLGRRVYLTGGFALGGHDELTVVDLNSGAVTRVGTGGPRPFAILRVP